jgi:branched-chain amino acid transport system substrate-binding protein
LIALSLGLACASGFAQNDAPVKVGLLSTLSGPGAGLGVDIRDGFQLAVKLSGGKFSGRAVDVIVPTTKPAPMWAAKPQTVWSSATRSTS